MPQPFASCLSPAVRDTLLQVALTAMPRGRIVPSPGPQVVDRVEAFLATQPPAVQRGFAALVHLLGESARLRHGRSFCALGPAQRQAHLAGLYEGSYAERQLLRVVLTALKIAHYDDPAIFAALGCTHRLPPVAEAAPPRYLQRALDGASLAAAETLTADVVVVGSGAGGAALAAELAERGLAVVLLEEGGLYRRADFTGRPLEMMQLLYRDGGFTATLGNCVIPVPFGRCVGGTTTVNSGTCYRTPPRVLRKWREELGLVDFTAEALEPWFAKVEAVLQVTPAALRHVGGVATVIGRGCDALGYRHGPLPRNAPDCDGSSRCCFGCPTDAKRSANISFVPLALRAGAQLVYNARVETFLVERGRAVGVVAATGEGRRLTVRAAAVVLSAGALMTPALLLRSGLANGSGQLGRNLSLHPALAPFALFAEPIDGDRSIPQGYGIEEFHDEGILFENVFVPLDFAAGSVTFFGRRYTEVIEAYDRIAAFGFMIEDSSRGRVRLGPGGRPLMTYVMNDRDVAKLKRGLELLCRIYLAGGAEAVFPMVRGFVEVRSAADLARLRATHLRARDFELTAHHPLGTARLGVDRRTSVVGPTHEAHDVPGLFVCDGSAVPTSLGVNPQVTIMALALRAAEFVARVVERTS